MLRSLVGSEMCIRDRYSNTQVNTVGTLLNAGSWAGIVGGMVMDRFGCRVTCLGAAVVCVAGFVPLTLIMAETNPRPSMALTGVLAFVAGQGLAWAYSATLKTGIVNFSPEIRGKVVGCLVCFFGLSGGIFSQIYSSVFASEIKPFFFFMSVLCPGLCVVGGLLLPNGEPSESEQHGRHDRLTLLYGLGVLTIVAVVVLSFVEQFTSASKSALGWVLIATLLLYPLTLIGVPLTKGSNAEEQERAAERDEEGGAWGMLTSKSFVLIFAIFMLLIGPGISLLNNLSPLVISRDDLVVGWYYVKKHAPEGHKMPNYGEVNSLVTLFAAFNTLARMGIGLCADRFKRSISTVSWLIPIAAMMLIGQGTLAFADLPVLYFGVSVAGMAYGGVFCILPILVSEVFGMAAFSTVWSTLNLAPTAGSFLFSAWMASAFQEHYMSSKFVCIADDGHKFHKPCPPDGCVPSVATYSDCQKGGDWNKYCYGTDCSSYSLLINTASCLVALALVLWLRRHLSHQSGAAKRPDDLEQHLIRPSNGQPRVWNGRKSAASQEPDSPMADPGSPVATQPPVPLNSSTSAEPGHVRHLTSELAYDCVP
eukprot:TRINITY_DN17171_c0_g1_i1.p1 TRINITY_DN17171_c0_g1~~TRINITY_DN17171_c0_g1_i1.p1  ORF type:complete len:592 (+),score=119.13 TRINITY_DN17171_c0_g1_i1:79-1854(+)